MKENKRNDTKDERLLEIRKRIKERKMTRGKKEKKY